MTNLRTASQTLIAFACDRELLRSLDNARHQVGEDRSTFIRKALVAELKNRKEHVKDEWAKAPDRARIERYPATPPPPPASSGPPSSAKTLAKLAVASVERPAAKYARKRTTASTSGKTSVRA